jgi:hypothetical protein
MQGRQRSTARARCAIEASRSAGLTAAISATNTGTFPHKQEEGPFNENKLQQNTVDPINGDARETSSGTSKRGTFAAEDLAQQINGLARYAGV